MKIFLLLSLDGLDRATIRVRAGGHAHVAMWIWAENLCRSPEIGAHLHLSLRVWFVNGSNQFPRRQERLCEGVYWHSEPQPCFWLLSLFVCTHLWTRHSRKKRSPPLSQLPRTLVSSILMGRVNCLNNPCELEFENTLDIVNTAAVTKTKCCLDYERGPKLDITSLWNQTTWRGVWVEDSEDSDFIVTTNLQEGGKHSAYTQMPRATTVRCRWKSSRCLWATWDWHKAEEESSGVVS